MAKKYQNKYRIASSRLQNWDYGCNAAYFITICTAHRKHYFGDVVNTSELGISMQLSKIGLLAQKHWYEIPQHFPFVHLGEMIIMPNHMHAIIVIDKPDDKHNGRDDRDAINRVSTVTKPELNNTGGITGNKNPMLTDNLSRIIRWYKGRITFESRKIHADFEWQTRFHDHIIRNDESFKRIQEYILTNPKNWKEDKFSI